jgi:hypothetical protein
MEANPWAAFHVSRLACWMKKAEAHMPFATMVAFWRYPHGHPIPHDKDASARDKSG